jgi:hypothetical protein
MTKQEPDTIRECADATRAHLEVLYNRSASTRKSQRNGILGDVLEGMEITATKLECLLKEKEHFPHDVCPGCGKPSIPLEGVPDQTGRGCGQCGREWFEDLSKPARSN